MWCFWIKVKNKIRFSWSNVIPVGFFTLFAATLIMHCSGWTDPHMPWNYTSQPSPQALMENSKVCQVSGGIRQRTHFRTYEESFWQLQVSKELKLCLWCLYRHTHTCTHTCTYTVIKMKICTSWNATGSLKIYMKSSFLAVWGGGGGRAKLTLSGISANFGYCLHVFSSKMQTFTIISNAKWNSPLLTELWCLTNKLHGLGFLSAPHGKPAFSSNYPARHKGRA